MKSKILGLMLLLVILPVQATASEIRKETFVYAVKGTDTLRMDKYDIPGREPQACMIFMFGGGFFMGERDYGHYVDYFEYLVDNGLSVVSIDYRLGLKNVGQQGKLKNKEFLAIFENAIMMAVEDLYDATNFVLANAGEWNIDPAMIVTCGSSAGAISVLQGEYERCNRSEIAQVLPEDFRYAGVISFAGAIYSNDGHLKWKDTPAPVQMFHGDADKNVPYGKLKVFKYGFFGSEYIARKHEKNGFPYYFYVEENTDHKVAGSPMTHNREEIISFLDRYVIEKQRLITNTVVTPMDKPKVKKKFGIKTYVETNLGI